MREVKIRKIQPLEDHCLGCGLCEVACIVEHSKSKEIIKAFKFEDPRPTSRTKVNEVVPVSISMSCRHCEFPFCMSACITGAIHRGENGLVLLDETKCVGCWSCVLACPYGAIHPQKRGYKDPFPMHAVKCDLCGDRDIPACVEACPNRALTVVEETMKIIELAGVK